MAISHQEIDVVDPEVKATVYGYIHRFERENESIHIIPDMLIFTCLQFYYIRECWDSYNASRVSVTNVGHSATKIEMRPATIYGRYIVTIPSKYIYHWTFKVTKCMWKINWAIGIDSAANQHQDTWFYCGKDGNYTFEASGDKFDGRRRIGNKLTEWNTGDEIDLFLNGINQTISIRLNGNEEPQSMMKVKDGEYKVATYMYGGSDSIELVRFTISG